MKYLFENEEKTKELGRILESWLNTPFRHYSGVKGLGCDCIHLVARVFEEMGMGPFKIFQYPKDWHIHKVNDLLINGIKEQLKVEEFSPENPINGDIILFKFGKAASHSALFYNGRIYHAVTNLKVLKTPWFDKIWYKRRYKIMRVLS